MFTNRHTCEDSRSTPGKAKAGSLELGTAIGATTLATADVKVPSGVVGALVGRPDGAVAAPTGTLGIPEGAAIGTLRRLDKAMTDALGLSVDATMGAVGTLDGAGIAVAIAGALGIAESAEKGTSATEMGSVGMPGPEALGTASAGAEVPDVSGLSTTAKLGEGGAGARLKIASGIPVGTMRRNQGQRLWRVWTKNYMPLPEGQPMLEVGMLKDGAATPPGGTVASGVPDNVGEGTPGGMSAPSEGLVCVEATRTRAT